MSSSKEKIEYVKEEVISRREISPDAHKVHLVVKKIELPGFIDKEEIISILQLLHTKGFVNVMWPSHDSVVKAHHEVEVDYIDYDKADFFEVEDAHAVLIDVKWRLNAWALRKRVRFGLTHVTNLVSELVSHMNNNWRAWLIIIALVLVFMFGYQIVNFGFISFAVK